MDWYENKLILLPQYPDRFPSKYNGCLFSISKSAIENYLKKIDDKPLIPVKIALDSRGIEDQIDGFQGYEAIVFNNNNVYLSVEAEISGQMFAYIIKGEIDSNSNKINLQPKSLKEIHPPVNLENMAFETLLIVNDRVIAIYEANGKNVNLHPTAVSFDLELQEFDLLTFPNIEYRITDVTRIDNNNCFWGINYLYEGDADLLNPAIDKMSVKYGKGLSHSENKAVERIVKFNINNNRIVVENEAPVQIKLSVDGNSRNWEGVVKYDSLGFLVITDKFPRTILAYIPHPLGVNDLFVFESLGKYGFKNKLDVEIIAPKFNFAQDFSKHGIAAVVEDSGWVYINKKGEKIIRPHVVDNGPDYFSFGLARFELKNKFGFFDEKGDVVIKSKFDYARPFADRKAAVCKDCQFKENGEHLEIINGKWGFINLKGKLIIPYIYDEVGDFENGYADVKENGKSVIIKRVEQD
ncbi:MAG: WG repeat-containing protein [Calditrichia bacterium]|nr:WG repeat-containing protein [Calditrichia bacterium]